ncbi:MAG: RIP metalloprotease RseP [Candidatus Moraniibacteriota bacterium]|nr:MAG: RIP metalloprotease RseP [Candidatus Moranbacteria bacterium]
MFTIIILFLIILSILVFVHELGHFVVARKFGMRVHEFGFGFPPRAIGVVKNPKTGKWTFVGPKVNKLSQTIYSLNWIPLGGFVRIKGEDGGEEKDPDSFTAKPALVRIAVLVAGVSMNFFLAWLIFSFVYMVGTPQSVPDDAKNVEGAVVQISNVSPESPAEKMGLRIGDVVKGLRYTEGIPWVAVNNANDVQEYINKNKGKEIKFWIKRGETDIQFKGVPREHAPEGQGALGIELARTKIISYPWYEAIGKAFMMVFTLIGAILVAFGGLLKTLVTTGSAPADIAGPVGIAFYTKQVADLGFVYVLQFAAILSVNLGIINILPIPALDGGRVLFIILEMIKGSPVSQKFEQITHTVGFVLLLLLMVIVTFFDFIRFDIIGKLFS